LIAAAKWWHLSARLALALRSQGCAVSALCPDAHPLTKVKGLEAVHAYSGLNSLSSLARAIEKIHPDIVIPCDDGVVAQLHALHANASRMRALIERSLGQPDAFAIVASRYRLMSVAAELGIAIADTRSLLSSHDIARWHEEVGSTCAIKVDGESGGNGVRMCSSQQEAPVAWRELSVPPSLATTAKRFIIDRDPLAVWCYRNVGNPQITAQRIIHGHPANCMVACQSGEVISLLSVAVLATDGPTGAAMIVRRIREERMALAAKRLAQRLQLSGFFGLDFIIDDRTGIPVLIEMNPRATQLGHLEFADQASLAAAFVAAWRGEAIPRPQAPISSDTVGLFPQALKAGASRHRAMSHLDVPRNEPELHEELRRDPWPQRRWLARIYHTLRPIKQAQIVEYEVLEPMSRDTRTLVKRGNVAARMVTQLSS
jgi:hypothetical protein